MRCRSCDWFLPYPDPALRLPILPSKIVLRQFIRHCAARVAHRVVYEADMRTPTSLAAVDRIQFKGTFMCRPKRAKVVIEVGKRGKLFSQLAGAHVAVVIDHGGRLARCAGKRPGTGRLEVCVLSPVVSGDCVHVGDVLDETLAGIVLDKHAIAVAFRQSGNVLVHGRKHCGGHLLDLVANQSLPANYIEILAVELKVLPHKLAQLPNLGVVVGADDGVYVESKTIPILRFKRIKRLDAIEGLLPIAGDTADFVVRFSVAVERDVEIKIEFGMATQRVVNNFINTSFDNFRNIATESWLAAREPEVGYRGHRA